MVRVTRCSYCGGPVTRLNPPTGQLNRPNDARTVWRCLLCNEESRMGFDRLCGARTSIARQVPGVSGNRYGR